MLDKQDKKEAVMIQLEALEVAYPDGTQAISRLSLEIGRGERVALVGANGAGKSTLLMTLMGVVAKTGGKIVLDGIELSSRTIGQIRQRAGLLFQNPDDQLFTTRVYDDVAFGLKNGGWPKDRIQQRVEMVLKQVGIFHLRDKLPHRLSGGEKRSVAIACVLALEPSILLMDEPTSFLDPGARRSFIKRISSLEQTQLIATHDLDMAWEICDRVFILEKGKLRGAGKAKALLGDQALLEGCGLELPLCLSAR